MISRDPSEALQVGLVHVFEGLGRYYIDPPGTTREIPGRSRGFTSKVEEREGSRYTIVHQRDVTGKRKQAKSAFSRKKLWRQKNSALGELKGIPDATYLCAIANLAFENSPTGRFR